MQNEELFIFRRMVDGDKEAFRFFFEKYYTDLCNFVNIYIHNPMISEEIVQDVFIYLWEKRGDLNIDSSVKSYLLSASRNKSLNYIRNEKAKMAIHISLAESGQDNRTPADVLDADQLRNVINDAINSLPDRCRQVYILGKEENRSYKQISEELGISVKTVEVHMGTALKKLREELRPYYKDIFMAFLAFLAR